MSKTLHLETLPTQALAGQIDELGLLQDGWFGESSKAPSKAALVWLRDRSIATFPEDLPIPGVAPTPEGGLFMEWVRSSVRVSVEILLPAHQAECQAVNLKSGESHEVVVDLDQP